MLTEQKNLSPFQDYFEAVRIHFNYHYLQYFHFLIVHAVYKLLTGEILLLTNCRTVRTISTLNTCSSFALIRNFIQVSGELGG